MRRILMVGWMVMAAGCTQAQVPAAQQTPAAASTPQVAPPAPDPAREAAEARLALAYLTRLSSALAATGGARELAFAATLRNIMAVQQAQLAPADGAASQASRTQASQWRKQAAARAGDDVLANALLMQGDAANEAAQRAQAAARWRKVEPDNLAPLLFAGLSADALLKAAGKAARYDLHFYAQLRWMIDAIERHPPGADEAAVLYDSKDGSVAEYALTASQQLLHVLRMDLQTPLEACQDAALDKTPTRRADCRHLAEVMTQASDTWRGETTGIALLARLAATDAERGVVDGKRRQQAWRQQQVGEILAAKPRAGVAEYLRLLRQTPAFASEQALSERILVDAQRSQQPPADWKMPQPQ